jgi:DNA-binding CsgD family transcriptional regulator
VLLQKQESTQALQLVDRVRPTIDESREDLRLQLEVAGLTGAVVDAATAWDVRPRTRDVYIRALQDPNATRELLGLIAMLSLGRNDPQEMPADFARRAFAAGPSTLPDDPVDMGWFSCAALALIWGERFAEARRILDQAVARARAVGDGPLLSIALSHRAWLELRASDLTAAEADAVTILDPNTFPVAPPLYRLMAGGVLGATLIYLGRFEEAERMLDGLSEEAEHDTVLTAVMLSGRGLLHTAQRRGEEAVAAFERAGDIMTRCGIPSPALLPWRSEKARAHLIRGQREVAEELARDELEDARKFGGNRALGVSLHTVGMATGEGDAEEMFQQAIECFDRAGVHNELASARKDLGALLRRQGRRVEARELLRQALDGAHRASAPILADSAEIELRATGAKPRRTVLTGLEALTASERRVAELAAEGMTNREIAQALFDTARTVEGHLTHVFRKLGVDSREHLTDALEQPVASD